MKQSMLVLTGVLFSLSAHAQVEYTLEGTYSADTGNGGAVMQPGSTFSFSFLVPDSIPAALSVADDGTLHVTENFLSASYTSQGVTTEASGGQLAFASSSGNETALRFDFGSRQINLDAYDRYGSVFPALFGYPDAQGQSRQLTGDLGQGTFSTIDLFTPGQTDVASRGTRVTVTGTPTMQPIPEPSCLALLAGALGLAGLFRLLGLERNKRAA